MESELTDIESKQCLAMASFEVQGEGVSGWEVEKTREEQMQGPRSIPTCMLK